MTCEFKLKNYCFHPERTSGEILASSCAYGWLAKLAADKKDSE